MFETLNDAQVEKEGSGRAMKVIGIVMAVLAVIFLIISYT